MVKTILKQLIVASLLLGTLCGAGGLVFTYLNGDEIKSYLLTEINDRLATKVEVKGEIYFSIFKDFPNASLSLEKVHIKNVAQNNDEPFLKTQRVA